MKREREREREITTCRPLNEKRFSGHLVFYNVQVCELLTAKQCNSRHTMKIAAFRSIFSVT